MRPTSFVKHSCWTKPDIRQPAKPLVFTCRSMLSILGCLGWTYFDQYFLEGAFTSYFYIQIPQVLCFRHILEVQIPNRNRWPWMSSVWKLEKSTSELFDCLVEDAKKKSRMGDHPSHQCSPCDLKFWMVTHDENPCLQDFARWTCTDNGLHFHYSFKKHQQFIWGFGEAWGMLQGYVGVLLEIWSWKKRRASQNWVNATSIVLDIY